MSGFVGRVRELRELDADLAWVGSGGAGDRGRAVLLRGRRRVGKSRLAEEFARRSGLPCVVFQAARGAGRGEEYDELAHAVASSELPGAAVAEDAHPATLTAALRLLDAALPADTPSIVILDEIPWLLRGAPGAAGELQRVWDQRLRRKPVLLLLLGSDLAMMEQLAGHDQPFHGRAREMVLDPLNPRDVALMTGLTGMAAFDGYLITGGMPLVTQEWRPGMGRRQFLKAGFQRATSGLVVDGGRALDTEFPPQAVAREVLTAIGARGERTFTRIQHAQRSTPLNAATLTAALRLLADKRVAAADEPLSTRPGSKDRRWRVADPGLRFWLAFVEPALGEVDRGRPDLALARVDAGFESWRGRAIEPVIRAALGRLLPDGDWPAVRTVGGWWPRTNVPEVDLVGADARPARSVQLVGSVKWRAGTPFGAHDLAALRRVAVQVPQAPDDDPGLVAVCPAGASAPGLARCWTAEDLLDAWA